MTIHMKPPAVRLVAPGGPVSRAVATMAAAHRTPVLSPEFDHERSEIHRLKETIRVQIQRDFDRIDRCLVLLDAIDGDPDLEPWLAGGVVPHEGGDDREDESEYDEPEHEGLELGWSANVGQLALGVDTEDADATALETHGCGFRRSGHEDAEEAEQPLHMPGGGYSTGAFV